MESLADPPDLDALVGEEIKQRRQIKSWSVHWLC